MAKHLAVEIAEIDKSNGHISGAGNATQYSPDLRFDSGISTSSPDLTAKLTEHELQRAVIAECDRRAIDNPLWGRIFHPASGEYRNKATAAKLKGMGVRRGQLDLYLIYPNWQGKGGWACELKVGKNRPTPEQQAEIEYLLSVGWDAMCIWDDPQAVLESLERYLGE
jgi:hypothetical protein